MLRTKIKKDIRLRVLPSLITYTNMILGITAIWLSFTLDIKNIKISCILVIMAAVADKIDGLVARKLNLTSKFGKELDTLCDLVSFGLAPIIIWWHLNPNNYEVLEMVVSLLFIGAGIFRLARFNVEKDDNYIIGLPITIAGSIVVFKLFIDINYRFQSGTWLFNENIVLLTLLSIFMVSRIRIKRPNI